MSCLACPPSSLTYHGGGGGAGKKKGPTDQLFDEFDANDLNKVLKNLMDGLSVKVFRTYNASVTLDRLLFELEASSSAESVDEKKADYDKANKEVGPLLCFTLPGWAVVGCLRLAWHIYFFPRGSYCFVLFG